MDLVAHLTLFVSGLLIGLCVGFTACTFWYAKQLREQTAAFKRQVEEVQADFKQQVDIILATRGRPAGVEPRKG